MIIIMMIIIIVVIIVIIIIIIIIIIRDLSREVLISEFGCLPRQVSRDTGH